MERSLFWRQGLFLQPQHFQLTDKHNQSLLASFLKYHLPYPWGVGEMQIQTATLDNRIFNLLKGDFIFPDGTYTSLPDNALIEARSFDNAWGEKGQPLDVYIGLRKWNEFGANVTVLPKLSLLMDVNTRFVTTAEPEEVKDLHHDGPPAQIQRLYHVLKIFWETEKERLGDYHLIPIARLERTGERVILSEGFIPPCLNIKASDILLRLIKDTKDQITSRSRQLEAYKRDRGIQSAEFGARDMVYLLALRSLNRYVPLLDHLTAYDYVSPWDVYAVLRQIIGELSAFSEQVDVMGRASDGTGDAADYDHRDLWSCFSGTSAIITRLLDEITAGPEHTFQLEYDGTYYCAELQPTLFEGRNRFYLVFETETDPKSLLQALQGISKLGSRESLPILIARSLPGVRLQHLPSPPQELPRRARAIYCEIDHHSDQWDQVQQGHNIALYWDTAPKDLKVELMVVGR
ncbi:MAG: type VI secretion system baseplate subunit TssK [Deltaproteobacteria bacterium]|nr:type VI secretion system baseplate subunit TssK [Deltaproteobacteria bacterium]